MVIDNRFYRYFYSLIVFSALLPGASCHADDVDTVIDGVIDDLIAFKLRNFDSADATGKTDLEIRQNAPRKTVARISTDRFRAEVLSQSKEQGVSEISTLYFPRLGGTSFQVTVVRAENEISAQNNTRLKFLSRSDITKQESVAGMYLRSSAAEDLLYLLDITPSAFLRIQPSHAVSHQQLIDFVQSLPIKELVRLP